MAIEIERKFLVKNEQYKNDASEQVRITQGYLNSAPERTVRVRTKGNKGYLTVKGISSESGASRYEWEKEIPLDEARALLALCEPGMIDKTRYLVPQGKHTFEVDEFYGENQGLVVAEVELTNENESFDKPLWLAQEVTGQTRYYNSVLMRRPYASWE
ncbi:CYTH domain-containing protein [Thalassomonas actiniarum]|uniref:CYTH domain-containing protein n=1 Tax=Thalassomonas actiniarum TaxID=485447 RepID=A0AAF0BZD1_9GAMM|nr:CYTH domain-containing protein [Thalassomonas actiniarum]WDD97866.1 CYTH domain-containing protein [Thalassomonas actiniarum]